MCVAAYLHQPCTSCAALLCVQYFFWDLLNDAFQCKLISSLMANRLQALTFNLTLRRFQAFLLLRHLALSENRVYSQWNSHLNHLIGIMISKTIGFRGTRHFQTHPCSFAVLTCPASQRTQKKAPPWSKAEHSQRLGGPPSGSTVSISTLWLWLTVCYWKYGHWNSGFSHDNMGGSFHSYICKRLPEGTLALSGFRIFGHVFKVS